MTSDQDRQRFELALSSADPFVALHDLAETLKAEGMVQVAMYHLFAEFQLKTETTDAHYDAIVDNMDLIWGGRWAKGRALFERELTSADVSELGAVDDIG